jgi:hypothetical protein
MSKNIHEFIRLVNKMDKLQHDCYRSLNKDSNKVSQCKAIEKRVDSELKNVSMLKVEYPWQNDFIVLVYNVRDIQQQYYLTKYDSVLLRCKQREHTLTQTLINISKQYPEIFVKEQVTQLSIL